MDDNRRTKKQQLNLSHATPQGRARMVDVGEKQATRREARAEAWVTVGRELAQRLVESGEVEKGPVLETARIAGIMAAKKTPELVPMCHPLPLDVVEIDARVVEDKVHLLSRVACRAGTGVEMEAMTAVTVGALTVYDMVKSAGKAVEIGPVRLLEKKGGRSGHWRRRED